MFRPKFPRQKISRLALLALPLLASGNANAVETTFRLINGQPVTPGTYTYVVNVTTNGAPCTGALVGPKTLITAAHCVPDGGTATFKVGSKTYTAKMKRSPIYNYPKSDHDVALGLVSEEIAGVPFVSIGGKAAANVGIQLLGYGCTKKPNPGEPPVSDGVLRIGATVITGFKDFDMVSRQANGAAICFGDSGGPALVKEGGKDFLLGITTKGNLADTNWSLRLDTDESKKFLNEFASQNGVKICGVNETCGGITPPPAPKCSLSANPNLAKKGETIVFSIQTEGQVTSASIDGSSVTFPSGSKSMVASSIGTFSAQGQVSGPGGSGSCSATYTVEDGTPPPQTPKCNLAAYPDSVLIGERVTLVMNSTNANQGTIDGFSVSVPEGKREIVGTTKGTFTALGRVSNANGVGSCTATYRVDDVINPDIPNFAVVPAFCGENVVTETKVAQVCIALVKKDSGISDLRLNQVVLVTYSDASKEVMPIMARKPRSKEAGEVRSKEDLFLYANAAMGGKYMVLDSRTAVLTKVDGSDQPTALEGRTLKGKYFLVEKLSPMNVTVAVP